MKSKYLYFVILICIISVISCKKSDKRVSAENIITEWMEKSIVFPSDITISYMGADIVIDEISTPYKILLYTDSTGCTSCKLKLSVWKYYIEELNSIAPESTTFLFYFQPKSKTELIDLLKQEDFRYPVYFDSIGEINQMNNFSNVMEYQCFLLNKDNQVIAMGNPTLNAKVWDLYKQIITKNEEENQKSIAVTSVNIEQTEIDVKNLKVGDVSTITFSLKNTGSYPLLISHIDASCGCTVPSWDKKPVKNQEETDIKVEIRPDHAGYFNKTIYVHANVEGKIIPLKIKGMVNDKDSDSKS